jgi:Leucine-rich repeat (LRR) protein
MKFKTLREAMEDYANETGVPKISELSEAILDGHSITELGDISFLKECTELGYISMNKCDIKKLEKFPAGLPIERLEICDNMLHDGLEALEDLEKLEELHLGGNQFDSINQLKPLAKVTSLRILDVTDCPVVKKDNDLHQEIFQMMTHLEAFNGRDSSGESVDFEDGSSDLDDYSSEDSEEDGDSNDDDDDDDSSDNSEGSDEEEYEDEGDDDEAAERPTKTARHE